MSTLPLRQIRSRIVTALATTAVLLLAMVVGAGPAAAFPAGAWWYQELQLSKAWTYSEGSGVTVAVIDDGVSATLGDLRGQVLSGTDFLDTGGNGQTVTRNSKEPNFSHGSIIAALIAGTGKGSGFVGVAPKAKILPIRIPTSGNASGFAGDHIADAIRYAVDHGAQIVNLSVGGPDPCTSQDQTAVDYAVRHDVLVVAASGDEGFDSVANPGNCVGAISVGGLAHAAQLRAWDGESSGTALDFVMPGDRTMSVPLLDNSVSTPTTGETSAAAALASGSFALLRSKFPHDSLRMLVTRALFHAATGRGTAGIGKRIDDKLGYGEILPLYALSESTPAGAANPIWDAVEKHLASSTPSASSRPSPSSAPASSPTAGSGGGSGPPPIVIVVVALVVVGLLVFGVIGLRRRSGARGRSAG